MEKYQNKYRIPSNRLPNWDYASHGAYFITICTKDMIHYFGEIINTQMQLSEIGKIANHFWHEISKHFPFVMLDQFIVMPNHIHGIIIITDENEHINNNTKIKQVRVETPKLGVSTKDTNKKQTQNASKKWQPGTLGVIINQYKRICTINARKTTPQFAWQSNYYDHIIRNNESYDKIKKYIGENPKNWQYDELYN